MNFFYRKEKNAAEAIKEMKPFYGKGNPWGKGLVKSVSQDLKTAILI